MRTRLSALVCTTALIMPALLLPQVSRAAEKTDKATTANNKDDNIEEIVVTSRKRKEVVFNIPDSISVFTADNIASAGIKTVADFANLTPNMFFTPTYRPSEMQMTMRGIPTAQGGEAPVAVVIDGVQISHPTFINQQLLDIKQIEVLRGPQGSLYGRNAIAGAINITTTQPTNDLSGMVRASYASGHDFRGGAVLSGPIVKDKLLFRVAGTFRNFRGQIPDQTARDGNLNADFDHSYMIKAAVILHATENLTFDLRGNYMHERAGAPTIEVLPRAKFDDWSQSYLNRNVLTQDHREIKEVSLKIDYQFNNMQLSSITDYSKSQGNLFGDADFSPTPFLLQQVDLGVKAFTQELRLASTGNGPVRWLGGVFYQHRDTDNFLRIPFDNGMGQPNGSFLIQSFDVGKSKSWAGYGSVSADIAKNMELTVGARYDHDKRTSVDAAFAGSAAEGTFKSFQPKVQLRYQWTKELNVYASFAKGFRSGGFNAFFAAGGADRSFKGETATNYEIGMKGQFLDGGLAINAAAFRTKFDHQQFFFITANPPSQNVTNINKVDITGAEFDVTARPTEQFDISASFGYVDATISDFNGTGLYIGNKTPQVPAYTSSLTANFRQPLTDGLTLHAYGAYIRRGPIYWDMADSLKTPAKDIVNLRLSLEGDQWTLGGYVDNLTDARYPMQAGADAFGPDLSSRVPSPKRQFGVLATYKF